MTWFKVDDDLAFHRKVVGAGNAAMGLWVRAGSWCAQHLTDGFIPDEMVAILGTASQRAKLIKSGLWLEVDGGCLFHQWSENGRQPTSKSVRERRASAAERQAKHRATIYENLQVNEGSHSVTHTSVTEGVTPLLTPPPTRPVLKEEKNPPDADASGPPKGAPRQRGRRIPDDFPTAHITPDMITWARANHPGVDHHAETERFTDYFRAAPGQKGVKLDWTATWRNWIRTAAERSPRIAAARHPDRIDGWQALKQTGTDNGHAPQLRALPGGDHPC